MRLVLHLLLKGHFLLLGFVYLTFQRRTLLLLLLQVFAQLLLRSFLLLVFLQPRLQLSLFPLEISLDVLPVHRSPRILQQRLLLSLELAQLLRDLLYLLVVFLLHLA